VTTQTPDGCTPCAPCTRFLYQSHFLLLFDNTDLETCTKCTKCTSPESRSFDAYQPTDRPQILTNWTL
jgi:hypothetical protein